MIVPHYESGLSPSHPMMQELQRDLAALLPSLSPVDIDALAEYVVGWAVDMEYPSTPST